MRAPPSGIASYARSTRTVLPEAERLRRAECARKAYFATLAAKSARARRARRAMPPPGAKRQRDRA